MAPTLGYLGLGNIGRGMSKNLVEKGNLTSPLVLYNRSIARTEALADTLGRDKTQVASTIAEAVKAADIIFSCVGTDQADKETYTTILEGDVKGKVFVDCSTVHPTMTNELAKMVTAKGGEYVACPSTSSSPTLVVSIA
jgi:3-hydroxyisobutyrate dehydrogenase-like beta-hydroxyacid dehydrogenase